MSEPIEVTVLRAWDGMVVTAWWDKDTGEKAPWLNVRRYRSSESYSTQQETTIRLSPDEVEKLVLVIKHGTTKGLAVPKNG